MTNRDRKIEALKEELVTLRRDFHRHPELGFQETRTQKRVMAYLHGLGLEPEAIGGTGVTALIEGRGPGKTVLLRTDMDAIPVQEEHDYEYRSQTPGVMHACGHDAHLAMMLGTAKIMSREAESFAGNIKLVFQPNEEEAGAYRLIEEGIMNNPRVDASLGMHIWSQTPSGAVDIDAGPVMAASHYFTLTIRGRGGHAGFAHEAVDPILVSTQVIQAVQAIQTREIDALNPAVIMFTSVHAGTSSTIVPEKVEMKGSLRFLYEGGEELRERFERIVKNTCEAHRVSYQLDFQIGNNLLSNSRELSEEVRSAALEIIGDEKKVTRKIHTMAGEDFADFCVDAPGTFIFLGTKNPEKGCDYPHHHPRFDIDEDVLPLGVKVMCRAALKVLNGN